MRASTCARAGDAPRCTLTMDNAITSAALLRDMNYLFCGRLRSFARFAYVPGEQKYMRRHDEWNYKRWQRCERKLREGHAKERVTTHVNERVDHYHENVRGADDVPRRE